MIPYELEMAKSSGKKTERNEEKRFGMEKFPWLCYAAPLYIDSFMARSEHQYRLCNKTSLTLIAIIMD
jgi:hypothetical protein